MASKGGRSPDILVTLSPSRARQKTGIDKLTELIAELQQGHTPNARKLQDTLTYAAGVLKNVTSMPDVREDELIISEDEDSAATRWVNGTFRRRSTGDAMTDERLKELHEIGKTLPLTNEWMEQLLQKADIKEFLQVSHRWTFDSIELRGLTTRPLQCIGFKVFQEYDLMSTLAISANVLHQFLTEIERKYIDPNNPYHNETHATEVTQAMHSLIANTNLQNWLSKLEMLACFLAAIIHDVDHPGTTNEFNVISRTELAIVYNDKSVLENHHLSTAFNVMNKDSCNILSRLNTLEFRVVRTMITELVLATDMELHSSQLKQMETILENDKLENCHKIQVMSCCLHWCDISHPMRSKKVNEKFTYDLLQEFQKQGQKEKAMGLPISPMCEEDNKSNVSKSQTTFIDNVVKPLLDVVTRIVRKELVKDDSSSSTVRLGDRDKKATAKATSANYEEWIKIVTESCEANLKNWASKEDGRETKDETHARSN